MMDMWLALPCSSASGARNGRSHRFIVPALSPREIVAQLMTFAQPAGAHCVVLINVCSTIRSNLAFQSLHQTHASPYVIQPFLQDVLGRAFLSRQAFTFLMHPLWLFKQRFIGTVTCLGSFCIRHIAYIIQPLLRELRG
ncbi:hypothetical protein MRX96_021821 [Rhipicephalus microplus]